MMKKFLATMLFTLLLAGAAWAQTMSDEQVVEYVKTATASGKSQQQIVRELAARGVTKAQAERIQKKYEQQRAGVEQAEAAVDKNRQRYASQAEVEQAEAMIVDFEDQAAPQLQSGAKQVFGRNIFNSRNLTFAPSQNIATPANYQVGPGDEIIIDIWGTNQNTIRQTISPDGYIKVETLGLVYLNGMSISAVEKYLKKRLSAIYAGISDDEQPASEIKVTLGQIRTIQINVMGEVAAPGTYALSSFSTVFHALYRAGGVNSLGSLRNIQLMRAGKQVAEVDVYDFILQGKTMDDVRLQEGDVIIVPPFEMLVEIQGNVKRPMYYEMQQGESVQQLIDYAGNFAGDAYKKNLTLTRQNGKEYQVYTVDDQEYASFRLMDGDMLNVGAMLDRYENRLEIKGAVYRPGIYQFGEELKSVKQLVAKADGVMGDAFLARAVLHREREDLTKEVIQVDLQSILNGTKADIALQKNDVLYIPSIHDLQDLGIIAVYGEVARPGEYPYADHTTLEDMIIQAGGLLESASTVRVDVARRIKDAKGTTVPEEIGEQFTFSLKDGFVVDGETGFELQPYDQIYVRKSPAYQPQQHVSVSGEILYAGDYALTKKNERLSDLVKKAGGITPYAYVKGARLMRQVNEEEYQRVQNVYRFSKNSGDSISMQMMDLRRVYDVGIDLGKAIANPGSDADIVLREGDRLVIPEYNNTVRIGGGVMYPNTVSYVEGKPLKYYIDQAGGYAQRAKKKRVYVLYMNGTIKRARAFSGDIVEPGCEVVVPIKEKNPNSLQNTLSIATTSASLATMIASIANILK